MSHFTPLESYWIISDYDNVGLAREASLQSVTVPEPREALSSYQHGIRR
jgi:hypothetical protein